MSAAQYKPLLLAFDGTMDESQGPRDETRPVPPMIHLVPVLPQKQEHLFYTRLFN